MAARTKTKVTPKYKTKYRVKNWAVYDVALRERGNIKIVIPPKKTATVDSLATGPRCQRNDAIESIGAVGRRQWRKESGAHQQARRRRTRDASRR